MISSGVSVFPDFFIHILIHIASMINSAGVNQKNRDGKVVVMNHLCGMHPKN